MRGRGKKIAKGHHPPSKRATFTQIVPTYRISGQMVSIRPTFRVPSPAAVYHAPEVIKVPLEIVNAMRVGQITVNWELV